MNSPTLKKGKEIKLPSHVLDLPLGHNNQLYASCLDGGIYQISTVSKPYEEIARHDNFASGINWSSSQKTLVSAGYDGNLKWINPKGKEEKRETSKNGEKSRKRGKRRKRESGERGKRQKAKGGKLKA